MKWLKSFKLFESTNEREVIIENIKDIFIDLKLLELDVLIGQDPGTPSIFRKSEKDERRILIDIYHKDRKEFNIDDISEEIMDLVSYSNSLGMPISLDVEVDRYAGSYERLRIKEYKDSKFISTEGEVLEQVRHISIRLHPRN